MVSGIQEEGWQKLEAAAQYRCRSVVIYTTFTNWERQGLSKVSQVLTVCKEEVVLQQSLSVKSLQRRTKTEVVQIQKGSFGR